MLQDFGKRLRNLRLKKGYKQSQLGDILNISASAVGMYERGQRQPSVDLILKLSKVFSVSADYLLGTAESPASVEEILKQIEDYLTAAISRARKNSISAEELKELIDILYN